MNDYIIIIVLIVIFGAFFLFLTKKGKSNTNMSYMGMLPDEIKSFHRRTMMVGFSLAICVFGAGGSAAYLEHLGESESSAIKILTVIAVSGVIGIMVWLFYRSLHAIPKCSQCRHRLKEVRTIEVEGGTWRIVYCEKCEKEYRIPGLSSDEG